MKSQNSAKAASQGKLRPVRVLQYTYGGEHPSGIDSYLVDSYHAVDRDRIQFDFLYRYACPLSHEMQDEIRSMGATLTSLGVPERGNVLRRQAKEFIAFFRFFRLRRFDVIEINMTSVFMCIQVAAIAWLLGARYRIVHAHDSGVSEAQAKRLLKRAAAPILRLVATDYWACSSFAAEYLFGASVIRKASWRLVKNAIDADRFAFDLQQRKNLRSDLGVEGGKLVAMVGRLVEQKNHSFGLRILADVVKTDPSWRLLIVGDGPLRESLMAEVARLKLTGSVLFLGSRSDVPAVLSAVDLLLAPSRHEGFPIVSLEAQAAGLPVLASTAFPPECNLRGSVIFCSLDDSSTVWARDPIWKVSSTDRCLAARSEGTATVRENGYDVVSLGVSLDARYREIMNRERQ